MKKYLVLLILTMHLMLITKVVAEDYYVSAEVDYMSVNLADEKYNPLLSKFKFGVMATQNRWLRGLGLELVAGQSLQDDQVNNYKLDINQHWAVYSTFSTENLGNLKFSINLGYASSQLESFSETLNSGIDQKIEGFSYGFAFEQRFSESSNFHWLLNCNQMFGDDNVEIAGCGLGVKYDF